MANLTTLQTTIGEAGASLNEFISDNKSTLVPVGVGVAGVVLGASGAVIVSKIRSSKKRKSKARSKRKRTGRARDRRFISKQKHEQAYQRRRKKAGKKTYGKRYKSKRSKPARLVKGSKAAKAYMAKLRKMRK